MYTTRVRKIKYSLILIHKHTKILAFQQHVLKRHQHTNIGKNREMLTSYIANSWNTFICSIVYKTIYLKKKHADL